MWFPEDVMRALGEDEVWEFVEARTFGRMAYNLVDEIQIVPLNYKAHDRRIYFRTAEGSKLLGLTIDQRVAFEVDDVSETHATSAIVYGTARQLEGREADAHDEIRGWLDYPKTYVIVVEPTSVSGRAFSLTRETDA